MCSVYYFWVSLVGGFALMFKSIKFMATALIALLGTMTVLIFGSFSYQQIKMNVENKYHREAELILNHEMTSFHGGFVEAEKTLNVLATDDNLVRGSNEMDDRQLRVLLELLQKNLANSTAVYAGFEDGKTIAGSGIPVDPEYDPRQRDWYRMAKAAAGKIVWTEPYLNYKSSETVITTARAIVAPEGKILGVVASDYNVSTMSEQISNARIGERGYLMLLSGTGTIIADKDGSMIGVQPFGKDMDSVFQHNRAGELSYTIQDQSYYIKYNNRDLNGMILVAAVNVEEINEKLHNAILPVLGMEIACWILICAIAYFAALNGIKPMEKLVKLMKQAEAGDYYVQSDLKQYAEIKSLSISFNNMIEGIRRRDEELTASYTELDKADRKLRQQYEALKQSQKELKESEEKVRHQAFYDSLTGLSNRERLNSVLTTAVEKTTVENKGGAVLYIDLDNFKVINDTMGHTIGDKVLVEISKRFNQLASFNKFFFRIGGDEFIAIVHGTTDIKAIDEFAADIIKLVEEQVTVGSKSFNITASVGVAVFPDHGVSVEELLKKADMAMYKAKETGKNRYRIFNESMQVEIVSKVNLEEGIRKALKNDEFLLYYQPQFDIRQRKISGMEVLLRWYSPLLGWVPPLQAIKVAEEMGLIVRLEKWIFKNACFFAKKVNHAVKEPVKVSVNISAVHIMQHNFVHNIKEIIAEVGVEPRWIELEITETAMMESFESNKKKLQELRQLGMEIHLDDFGSGYSSLNYLQNLPIDYVKIDKIFVDSMLNSERESRITATIVELAHNIGLKVVAEGVENNEQYEQLRKFGCDIIQGYYIGKPMPEEAIVGLLKAG